MTTIKFHNTVIKGVQMPSSAADGYLIRNDTDTVGTLGSISDDDGSIITFDIENHSVLTDLKIAYSTTGKTITVESLKYYLNNFLVMEFTGVNIVGSRTGLESGDILSTRITNSDDDIIGTAFADKIFGGPGSDQIFANAGNDFVSGDAGDDRLSGMTGNDKVFGGSGADILSAGPGKDLIYGGGAGDVFLFDELDDKDTIKDFDRKDDAILIDKSLARKFKQLKAVAEEYRKGVKLDFHGDDLLKIEGINLNKLKKIDFDFSHL